MKIMKRILSFIAVLSLMLIISCTEFLDYTPRGTISSSQLNTPETIDQLVIAAYASLGNDDREWSFTHMWMWGSLRSDDAYKGGGGVSNRTEWHEFETFSTLRVDNIYMYDVWVAIYQGISRANDALQRMENMTEAEYPKIRERQAECRFIRGHFHFLLKQIFKYPVWADHTIAKTDLGKLTNREYNNDQFWDKIAEDFQSGIDNLPVTQTEIGRASRLAAYAYLAKVRLYQAYEQNEQNSVININGTRLNQVVNLCDEVIASGKYSLFNDFGKNFLYEYENGSESIFAIQYSLDDGVLDGRVNRSSWMNFPMNPEYGCCWFNVPAQNLVNSYRTDANGLPLFDSFNNIIMKNPTDFLTNSVDPRLDHTVGIPSHPYKYVPTFVYQIGWARVPEVYGPFSTMKEVDKPNCPCLKKRGAYIGSSKNIDILRYDDVLLIKAEALIELGRELEALPIINQIRVRAKNSTGWLKKVDGTFASNYKIDEYINGVNCTWTQDYARKALRFERRLEFAMEGYRFFDLVRWGIAAETLNSYFNVEKTRYQFLKDANFKKGRDEYMPIPQGQIDLVNGIYTQNNGW